MAQFGFLVSDFTDRFYGITTNVAVVVIKVFDTTVNVDGVPLKVTLVAPVRICSQNSDALAHCGASGHCFHELAKTGREAEDRAVAVGAANVGCAIEVSVGGLSHRYGLEAIGTVALRAE